MKNRYTHIIKKTYQKPVIEEILLDREMSLVMSTKEPPVEPETVSPITSEKSKPEYGTDSYSNDYPLGGSRPIY